ncbi:MAG: hypothetical protein NXI31_18990 [bacterium]|nr:hypothetical protein [bacterium]
MRRSNLLLSLPLLLLAACGDAPHPLAGSWNQALADGKKGISVEFSKKSDKCFLHGAPRADGTHDHANGTYTFDEGTGAITVKMKLLEDKAATDWAGKLENGAMTLSSADGKVELRIGESAH